MERGFHSLDIVVENTPWEREKIGVFSVVLRRNEFGSAIVLFAEFDFGIDHLLLVSKCLNSSKNAALKDVTPTTILLYSFYIMALF